MKTSQWNEERIIGLLQQAEKGEITIAELCHTHGVSETGTLYPLGAFYKWRHKYGGLQVSEAKRLRELEQENNRLKKLLAESILDNSLLNVPRGRPAPKKVTQPQERRALVQEVQQHSNSRSGGCARRLTSTAPASATLRSQVARNAIKPSLSNCEVWLTNIQASATVA